MHYVNRKINCSVYYLRKRSHITIVYSYTYAIHNLMNHEHNNYNYYYSNIIIQNDQIYYETKEVHLRTEYANVLQIKTVL